MTTYATRSPLQPLLNPHMMSELRRSSRRTSATLAQKEDPPVPNVAPGEKEREKLGRKNGSIAKPGKAAVNGDNSKTTGQRGKRKLDYDEEADGFAFARTRSKKAKAEAAKPPEPIVEESPEKIKPTLAKRSAKKSFDSTDRTLIREKEQGEKRRRSPRLSGDKVQLEPQPLQVKKKRPKESKLAETRGIETELSIDALRSTGRKAPKAPDHVEISFDATKIALPFADTPIIRRNKEMRKGVENGYRRSSLGNRGRRASSLIDGGKSNALPHDKVDSSEFYKHIENGLPEPRRMKQLLTWCGTRALMEKPSSTSETYHASFAAREIQQQILKDFSTKSEMSDWFSRRDSTPPPKTPKPNPKNISNLAKIEDLEQQIAHLQLERQTWESLLRAPSTPNPLKIPPPSPNPASISAAILFSPSQIAIFTNLQTHDSPNPDKQHAEPLDTAIPSRLAQATNMLEHEIDKFADNVHLLRSYVDGADRMADQMLAISADALEERERRETERSGGDVAIRNVLRGLSRVIER